METTYIPEKINNFNVYVDDDKLIGAGAELTLPEASQKTSTVDAAGTGGEIDTPTIGQFESMEQEIEFNTLYSSIDEVLPANKTVALTIRAAQQVYDKSGSYTFKGLRVVEQGIVKKVSLGDVKKGEPMAAKSTLEVLMLAVYVDDDEKLYIDKPNNIFRVNGEDQLEDVNNLI